MTLIENAVPLADLVQVTKPRSTDGLVELIGGLLICRFRGSTQSVLSDLAVRVFHVRSLDCAVAAGWSGGDGVGWSAGSGEQGGPGLLPGPAARQVQSQPAGGGGDPRRDSDQGAADSGGGRFG